MNGRLALGISALPGVGREHASVGRERPVPVHIGVPDRPAEGHQVSRARPARRTAATQSRPRVYGRTSVTVAPPVTGSGRRPSRPGTARSRCRLPPQLDHPLAVRQLGRHVYDQRRRRSRRARPASSPDVLTTSTSPGSRIVRQVGEPVMADLAGARRPTSSRTWSRARPRASAGSCASSAAGSSKSSGHRRHRFSLHR